MKKTIVYDYQKLKDYALWYYFRYFPSVNKLKQKLLEKSLGDSILSDSVFDDVKDLLEEEKVLEGKIKNYLFKNKNINYIKNKLREKLFNIRDIEENIRKFTREGESVLSKHYVSSKILYYINQGKSRNYIRNKLIERREDTELIDGVLFDLYTTESENNAINSELKKIGNKNFPRQKIIEKLLRKGFKYGEIIKILD